MAALDVLGGSKNSVLISRLLRFPLIQSDTLSPAAAAGPHPKPRTLTCSGWRSGRRSRGSAGWSWWAATALRWAELQETAAPTWTSTATCLELPETSTTVPAFNDGNPLQSPGPCRTGFYRRSEVASKTGEKTVQTDFGIFFNLNFNLRKKNPVNYFHKRLGRTGSQTGSPSGNSRYYNKKFSGTKRAPRGICPTDCNTKIDVWKGGFCQTQDS